jgi:hypothetical protein
MFQPKGASGFDSSVVVRRKVLKELWEEETALLGVGTLKGQIRLISPSTDAEKGVVGRREGGLLVPKVVED